MRFLMACVVFASVSAASIAQTKPAQKKADAQKECHEVKKECKKADEGDCCMSSSRAKAISTAKKPAVKKGQNIN